MNLNQKFFDASLRHEIAVRRYASGEVKRVLLLLEKMDRELVSKLRERLSRLGHVTDFTSKRLKKLLEDVRYARVEAMTALRQTISGDLLEFAKVEVGAVERILTATIPIDMAFATVQVSKLREVIYRRPFQGKLLGQWFRDLELADRRNLTQSLQMGISLGESVPQMMARVAGTRIRDFTDGPLAATRRNAEAVVRTAVNHVSNQSREVMFEENSDVVAGLRWTSTLDGRTTKICMARDGHLVMFGGKPLPEGETALDPPGARPPAHVNCRSTMVALLDGEGILGTRATVTDTRRRREREIDLRALAREEGITIQEARARWAAENVGFVPAKTTYNDWLRGQSAGFQDEVLGRARGQMFRSNEGLTLDAFVDRRGNELTLKELEARGL